MKTATIRRQTHDDGSVSMHAVVDGVVYVTTEGDDLLTLLNAVAARVGERNAVTAALWEMCEKAMRAQPIPDEAQQ